METFSLASVQKPEVLFHLPDWRSPIIGRQQEMDALETLLLRDDVWLVTITGPGGVGKSRLAHAVARNVAATFHGNVAWIPLAPVQDAERAVEIVAHHLGLAASGMAPEQAIALSLEGRRSLLVFDNLEQIPDFASFISRLGEGNPEVKILATSRVPLFLRDEREFALSPFPMPEEGQNADLEVIAQVPAIELFVARAQAADSRFTLNQRNVPAVMAICRRLDGLPLAIELAAARVRLLPPEAMVSRLTHALDLLTSGPRDAEPRHQTLRNTIQWSYDLLPDETQRVFRALGVFPGAFSIEAAQAVGGGADGRVLDHLSLLLDHSLLIRLEHEETLRFAMLDTIREFAAGSLVDAAELRNARESHAAFFSDLIASDEERPGQNPTWLDLVDQEVGNLRVVLDWLETQAEAERLHRLCNLMSHWWLIRGSVSEGYDWFRKADRIEGSLSDSTRIMFDLTFAWLATQMGNFDLANALVLRVDPTSLSDPSQQRTFIKYLMVRGALAFFENDLDSAYALIEEARRYAEGAGIVGQNPSVRINLAAIARVKLDFEEARRQHVLGLQESSSSSVQGMHTCALAEIEVTTSNLEQGWDYLQQTWRVCRTMGDMLMIISAMATKAELLLRIDRAADAAILLGAAHHLRKARGWPVDSYTEAEYRGLLEQCQGRLGEAAFDAAMDRGRALSQSEIDALMVADPFDRHPIEPVEHRRRLTTREAEVLGQLTEGKTNPEIAEALFISERTVQTHVANILQKLNVTSRSAAAVVAVRENLVS